MVIDVVPDISAPERAVGVCPNIAEPITLNDAGYQLQMTRDSAR